jgi:hypothetical protein
VIPIHSESNPAFVLGLCEAGRKLTVPWYRLPPHLGSGMRSHRRQQPPPPHPRRGYQSSRQGLSGGRRVSAGGGYWKISSPQPLWHVPPSRHAFFYGGKLVAGPVSSPGSGWVPIVYGMVWVALFVLYMQHIAQGAWLVLGPLFLVVSLGLLWRTAYSVRPALQPPLDSHILPPGDAAHHLSGFLHAPGSRPAAPQVADRPM